MIITLRQFQHILKIQDSSLDPFEQGVEIVGTITGKTGKQLEEMPILEFNHLSAEVSKAITDVVNQAKAKRVARLHCGKHTYQLEHNIKKMNYGQWVTVMHFVKNEPIKNAHLILATIARPVRWGYKFKGNHAHHNIYAEHILDAPVNEVYNACLFFCKLFKVSLAAILDYSTTQEEMKQHPQILRGLQDSISIMDGFIQQNK